MLSKILTYSFYLLFFLTPLIWFPWNFELFEYNKMVAVYFLTLIITASWILKMINRKSLNLHRTPLDIPLLAFLLANILSTIFSIDPHTSIWGYYSRSNGGLLSLVSYLALYYALVSNFEAKQAVNFLKAAVFGGVAVALWAIPEHFGVSPSCVILTNQFGASCWVQDVQARVFATLGQPNWLAAYLAMLIFPAIYFALTETHKNRFIPYTLYSILFYAAFTFTYSRGATLGLWAGLAVFLGFLTISTLRLHPGGVRLNLIQLSNIGSWIKQPLILALISFITINLLFGSALTQFKLLSKFAGPERPTVAISKPVAKSTTQLESGGTESGQIRLIVWKGAVDIFRHYPIFGSGVETFAYSYYNFRPTEHNLVSEWDFLYNKAHNEFLNYLATTGIIGFLTYMAVILTFIIWSIRFIVHRSSFIEKQKTDILYTIYDILLPATLLASYTSYLVQNFFGFSVVSVALLFYLFPALAFTATGSTKPFTLPKFLTCYSTLLSRQSFYPKLAGAAVIIIFGLMGFTLIRNYIADIYFATGNQANESGNPGRAYNFLSSAVSLNPGEPYYRSELGYAAAASASVLIDQESTLSAQLKATAIEETNNILESHPKNVSFFRTAIRTFYMLSTIDKEYTEKTLQILDKTIALSPTDTKLTYNKAIILGQMGKNEEAIEALEQTVKLKPNYRDAHYTLGLFLFETGQKEKAIEEMDTVLKLIPNDPEATEKLEKWQ